MFSRFYLVLPASARFDYNNFITWDQNTLKLPYTLVANFLKCYLKKEGVPVIDFNVNISCIYFAESAYFT